MRNSTYAKSTDFSKAVQADIKRSVFDRSSTKKTAFTAGKLVPIYLDEVLPGDTFDMSASFISRLSTPIFPTMDNLELQFYAFYCPNRLLWTGWESLCGENKTGAWTPSSPPNLVPYVNATDTSLVETGSLCDYLDIPVGVSLKNLKDMNTYISALPFRMYYRVWNEWFRDENLQAPISVYYDDTLNVGVGTTIRTPAGLKDVNKPHDYFTSCLPQPQKGSSTLIPIEFNELIPVISGTSHNTKLGTAPIKLSVADGSDYSSNAPIGSNASNGNMSFLAGTGVTPTDYIPAYISNLWADARGIQATSSTIADLRTAFQLQKLYERDARGGTRYVEMLKAHFGVDAQDYRLQRTEYLGKISSNMGIYQVAQTSSTDDVTPQGNLSAFGYTSGNNRLFSKSFVEHGYVMVFAVARQRKTYQQGIDKLWTRRERFDFYYPALAHISEQPVYKHEIYAYGSALREVFGYQEAWADYRYKPSKVSGLMRTGVTGSLSAYHYADYYTDQPLLSADWIVDNTATNLDRTLAVPSSIAKYQIILDVAFNLRATRPMPVYGIPGMVDHF